MVQFRNRMFASLVAVIIVAAASLWVGCSDRDDRPAPEDPDPAFQQAAGALDRAQDAMQKAGVDINFSDIGALGNLATILPDPLEL
ncbi:MAG: hypothetical protein O7E52_21230, partial [Candidatus Poribacteria bacterium]|nr:hypothetical protein [Candidatus Poribacteria bacterium]